ncbi:DeoR/GlpR family DNA-binding transcription regulator [Acidiphilium iwatense]|uniref:DeoR/GlpR family DNA-binding transcription regulator n=1 Tax=Acidiphilium iwatense TaxID=768198 RepID=A0ABS9DYZ8_9PROT|nr:DeoR/GlpR family DNA-binding transcription regulator [Acidiphilium iwatense]MCF3946559.1 DeoR/GlpR family DNA-binding transcription regulator [Acidiphilium iwatense]
MIGAKSAVLQRRLKIADWIRQHGQMRVDELSTALMVSEVTIRGDLSYLEEQGLIVRSFGKAIATKSAAPRDRPVSAPLTKALLVPMLRRAQSLIEPDQTVLIGPGDLAMQLIPWLAEIPGLSVLLANVAAIPLARACLDARVHLLGGEINAETGALEGAQTIRGLDHYPLGWTIIEADALSADAMLLLASKSAERLGEAALRRAARSIVLVGSQALSLERRAAHLPLAGISDIILPSAPSNRARDIMIDAGFRPIDSDGGTQAHFCSHRPSAERAARTAGEAS